MSPSSGHPDQAYMYVESMPDPIREKPKREAVEDALELLAARDTQHDAMHNFIDWATTEWGEPTNEEKQRADEIWSNR